MGISKNKGLIFTPQIIHFNRVWNHYFHHPFSGFPPIFGLTPIYENEVSYGKGLEAENHSSRTFVEWKMVGLPLSMFGF